jgi:hypothetical protein
MQPFCRTHRCAIQIWFETLRVGVRDLAMSRLQTFRRAKMKDHERRRPHRNRTEYASTLLAGAVSRLSASIPRSGTARFFCYIQAAFTLYRASLLKVRSMSFLDSRGEVPRCAPAGFGYSVALLDLERDRPKVTHTAGFPLRRTT